MQALFNDEGTSAQSEARISRARATSLFCFRATARPTRQTAQTGS